MDNINYELQLLNKKGIKIYELQFHGDNTELAKSHAMTIFNDNPEAYICEWRKIGNHNWKQIKAN